MLVLTQRKSLIVNTEKMQLIYVENERIIAEDDRDVCYVLGEYMDDHISNLVFRGLTESVWNTPMFVMPARDFKGE